MDYEETSQSLTEITTEITTENTTETSSSTDEDDELQDVIAIYESNIGVCTGIISDKIKKAIDDNPNGWVLDAVNLGAEKGARSWGYIETILANWQSNGKGWKPGGNGNGKDSEENYRRYIEGEFKEFLKQ